MALHRRREVVAVGQHVFQHAGGEAVARPPQIVERGQGGGDMLPGRVNPDAVVHADQAVLCWERK